MKKILLLLLGAALYAGVGYAQAPVDEVTLEAFQSATTSCDGVAAPRALKPRGEKMGLLVIFHGSEDLNWFRTTDHLTAKIKSINAEQKVFAAVECVNMETQGERDLVDGVAALEAAGCDAIVAVPALVYPTGHVLGDIPALLDVWASAETRAELCEEGLRPVRTKLPVTLAGSLADCDHLKNYVVDQAKSISKDPKNERVILVAHGNGAYLGLVKRFSQPSVEALAAMGFDKIDEAYVGMGETFADDAIPVVRENTKDGKKTLVIALYINHAGKDLVEDLQRASKQVDMNGLDWVGNETSIADYETTPAVIYQQGVDASKY